MHEFSFAWDEKKNQNGSNAHGVSFQEAQSVFLDESAVHFFDKAHSENEDRFIMIGLSSNLRVLLVVHTFREDDGVIRIISALKPTANELRVYMEQRE